LEGGGISFVGSERYILHEERPHEEISHERQHRDRPHYDDLGVTMRSFLVTPFSIGLPYTD